VGITRSLFHGLSFPFHESTIGCLPIVFGSTSHDDSLSLWTLMGYYWGGAKLDVDAYASNVITAVFVLVRLISQKVNGTYDFGSAWFNHFWFTAMAVLSAGSTVHTLYSLDGGPFSSCETSP